MTYSESQDIARRLANADTKAAQLLRAMCKETGRRPTFIIMRYGDPREWTTVPKSRDQRKDISKRLVRRAAKMNGVTKGKRVYIKMGKKVMWHRRTKDWRSIVTTRPCTLEHIDGRVIRAKSIVEFCKRAKLPDSRYHITPVLDGQRPTHKDWYLPETLARKIKLRDIYGNVGEYTVKDLLTKHGLKIPSISGLLDGRKKSIGKGWAKNSLMLTETSVDSTISPRSVKITKVKLTDGRKTYTGSSIPEAMRKAGVTDVAGMYRAAYGFRDEVQGIRVKEIEAVKRRVIE